MVKTLDKSAQFTPYYVVYDGASYGCTGVSGGAFNMASDARVILLSLPCRQTLSSVSSFILATSLVNLITSRTPYPMARAPIYPSSIEVWAIFPG